MTVSTAKSTDAQGIPERAQAHEKVYKLELPRYVTAKWLIERGFVRRTAYRLLAEPSRIDLATLAKLCTVLDCTPNDLLET